ncbi:microfibril-associated protein MFAP1 domain-containing protein [Phanerochaete sordida]|uniref:Microfibril-associated protein MFAP1 domain-containing protein n=1 Tax=Phanerochaete sordida TaxID=48140 RepID=A0A9P3LJL2_9APHY|nr:microfibril-associated protein MFAP1 domain-containing protein [Phanerochaete sordida]
MSTVLATTVPRKTAARLPKPAARYRRGQAPKGAVELPSDSEEEDEGEQPELDEGDEVIEDVEEDDLEVRQQVPKAAGKGINVTLRDVNISREGKVIIAGREEVGRTEAELEEESEEEDEDEEAAKPGEESSEYESESESEEEPPKPQFRPVFIPKRARATVAEKDALAQDTEEAIKRKEEEAEERRRQSHNMVAESIKRELLEKEKEAEVPDVDDTDGLDPEGEFEAWRLRELARIKRDKEEAVARELEREEIERRRALPEEQRLKEDLEHAEKTRQDKPKGQQKFLQKYWHKGAFHQDDDVLKKHDYTEATESTMDVSLLPKVMQVKNFGKRGRTKYTHLLDQDTTVSASGAGASRPGGKPDIVCFQCGGPHLKKDCPQNTGPLRVGTGANSTAPGERKWGPRGDRDEGRDSWRDRDRDDGYRRPRDDRGDDRDRRRDERYGARDERGDGRERRRDDYDRRDRGDKYNSRRRSQSPRRERWRDEESRHDRHRPREGSVEYDREEKRRRLD